MRFALMCLGLLVMAAAPASATEHRITVTEIHNFVQKTAHAMNDPNRHTARSTLNTALAENASFSNKVSVYNPAGLWHQAWYGHPAAYGAYYRYPTNPYYNPTSLSSLRKWDQINLLENKKRAIPGYEATMDITGTTINPYGTSAVVDLDMKEYSLAYTPYHPTLAGRVLHANSKCKMYLSKVNARDLMMTRMDCNTNTNLPF
ncbi:MAG: hypothetical protein H6867_11265 [Rhodospirillales bacterium]|nr:hypothetical protein [Rhodospirillales bacterium]MCB9996708.1 hypothetical protein [Rhodospirillales bacterium]